MIRNSAVTLFYCLFVSSAALLQSDEHFWQRFKGTNVVLKMDMPVTEEGVNFSAERLPRIDGKEYGKKLRRYGTLIHKGNAVKKKNIEVHFSGGGYSSQYVRAVSLGNEDIKKRAASKTCIAQRKIGLVLVIGGLSI